MINSWLLWTVATWR